MRPAEEGADIVGEQFRLFERREMPARGMSVQCVMW
jgi:hypothetical protein